MDAVLQNLKTKVTASTTVKASATTLINGIAERIRIAVEKATNLEPLKAELTAIAAELESGTTPLAEAVVANTEAA